MDGFGDNNIIKYFVKLGVMWDAQVMSGFILDKHLCV